jgi:O-antigen/teichoic acid export membrane protein
MRLAPLLGTTNYGYFNIVLITASIFSILSVFGLRTIIVRSIAREPNQSRAYFLKALQIRSVFFLLSIALFLYYNYLFSDLGQHYAVIAVMVLMLTTTLWDTMESTAFGRQLMKPSAYIELGATCVWVISLYLIPREKFTVNLIIETYIIIQLIKNIVYFIWLFFSGLLSGKSIPAENTLPSNSQMLKMGTNYFLLAVFTCLQNQFPILFLGRNSGLSQVGIFNVGYRILSPLQMVINTALIAVFPNLSVLSFKKPELFYDLCKKGILFLLIVGTSGSLIFTVFSKEVVLLIYGDEYVNSARVISTQCWYTVMYGLFCFIGTIWGAMDKQKILAIFAGLGTCTALPVFWFGSKYNAEGLAFGFIITAIINLTFHWYYLAKKTFVKKISMKYTLGVFSGFFFYMTAGLLIPQDYTLINKLIILIVLLAPIVLFISKKYTYFAFNNSNEK